MRPNRSLPPLELALGVNPSQTANCRPDVNRCGSVTVAARADAEMTPNSGMVSRASRDLVATEPRHQILIEVPYAALFFYVKLETG